MTTRKTEKRWWDIPSTIVLIWAIMSAAARLYATQWTTDLERIQTLTFLGIVLGLALGQSSFSPRVVRIFAFIYGLFFIPWQLGLTQPGGVEWRERLISLFGRLQHSTRQVLQSQGVEDSILFIALMAVLFFILGLVSGYYLTRYGNVWASIIPAGVAILIINHYDLYNAGWGRTIGTYLFFSLLLVGRMTFLRYRAEWQDSGVSQSPETSLDLGRASLVVVIVLILLAWNIPALAASSGAAQEFWHTISQPWDSVRNRFSDAFSSLKGSVSLVSDFYGDTLALGTGTRLGDDLVLVIEGSTPQPRGVRYYWRARNYDTYQDGDWASSYSEQTLLDPAGEGILYPEWLGRRVIQFSVITQIDHLQTLYTGPIPLWVSRPSQAHLVTAQDGSMDVGMLVAEPALRAGETYRVRSWVSSPTIDQLRESSMDYPDWVEDRYLEFPENLSDRIPELAKDITAGLDNPYDKTVAITQYLRDTITYSTTVPNPPDGMDSIEWFLFDYQQGYCNYYATAEVLMLRSVGIPARLAAGFAQGELQEDSELYYVRHRDAHAWPEVYFDGIGWVEFEPTVSQEPREFLTESQAAAAGINNSELPGAQFLPQLDEGFPERDLESERDFLFASRSQQARTTSLVITLLSLVSLALIVLGWRTARQRYNVPPFPVFLERKLELGGMRVPTLLRRWSYNASLSPLEKAYGTLNLALQVMGSPAEKSATPAERAESLTHLVPPASESVHALRGEYELSTYSSRSGSFDRARQASSRLRWVTVKAFLSKIFLEKPEKSDKPRPD